MIEDGSVEQNDEAGQLTTERRGVGKHQTIIYVTDGHRYLLMFLSERLNIQV